MALRQKKTDCPSRLTLRAYCNRPRNLQKLPVSDHLCKVETTYNHNHPVNTAHSLSFRDVSEETKAKFASILHVGILLHLQDINTNLICNYLLMLLLWRSC